MIVRDPSQRVIDGWNGRPRRKGGPTHHMHLEAKSPRCFHFGAGGASARILREDIADVMRFEELGVVVGSEWTARRYERRVREFLGKFQRIDDADHVAMMWRDPERVYGLAPKCGKDALRCIGQSRHGRRDAIVFDPVVAMDARPWRTFYREERNAGGGGRCDGVGADARREGVRRVEEKIDIFAAKIVCESLGSTEAADAHGEWGCGRIGCASSQRQRGGDAGVARKTFGKCRRLGRSAEKQNAQSCAGRSSHHRSPMP